MVTTDDITDTTRTGRTAPEPVADSPSAEAAAERSVADILRPMIDALTPVLFMHDFDTDRIFFDKFTPTSGSSAH